MSKQNTVIKITSMIISFLIVLVLFLLIIFISSSNNLIAEIDGSILNYKNKTYKESYETIDIDIGRCLGKAVFKDDNSTAKLYKLKGYDEYLYVNMGFDHRIYKLIDNQ